MSDWFVGQNIECVNAKFTLLMRLHRIAPLVQNRVYEIREIWEADDGLGFCLVGVNNVPRWRGEPGYWSDRFRPVVETKTDISVFTNILLRESQRQLQPADCD